jgi:hypothetical protein
VGNLEVMGPILVGNTRGEMVPRAVSGNWLAGLQTAPRCANRL